MTRYAGRHRAAAPLRSFATSALTDPDHGRAGPPHERRPPSSASRSRHSRAARAAGAVVALSLVAVGTVDLMTSTAGGVPGPVSATLPVLPPDAGPRRSPSGPTPRICRTTAPRSATSAPRPTRPPPEPRPRPPRTPPPRPPPTPPRGGCRRRCCCRRRRLSGRPPPSRPPATPSASPSSTTPARTRGGRPAPCWPTSGSPTASSVPQLAVDPREQLAVHRDEPVLRRIRDPAVAARVEDGQRRPGLPHQPRDPDQVGAGLHQGSLRNPLRRLGALAVDRLVLTLRACGAGPSRHCGPGP